MRMRKGLGKGLGTGYKNLAPLDSHIHSLSAKGVKSLCPCSTFKKVTKLNSKGRKIYLKNNGDYVSVLREDGSELETISPQEMESYIQEKRGWGWDVDTNYDEEKVANIGIAIKEKSLKNGVEVDFPSKYGHKAIRYNKKNGMYELYDYKTGEVFYKYDDLKMLVKVTNQAYNMKDYVLDAKGKSLYAMGWVEDNDYKWKKGQKIKYGDRTGVLLTDVYYKSSSSSGWNEAKVKWSDGTESTFTVNKYGVKKWGKLPYKELNKIPKTDLVEMLTNPYSLRIDLDEKEGRKRYAEIQKEAKKRGLPLKKKVVEVSQFFDTEKETWKSIQNKKERGVLPSTTGKSYLWGEVPKIKLVNLKDEPKWGQVWYEKDKDGKFKLFKANYDSSG